MKTTVDLPVQRRVLVVDDEAAVRRMCRAVLERGAFVVDEAADGTAALGQVRQTPYDLVLSDIDMPGLGGLDLLRAVRIHDLDVPVILMTGKPDVGTAIAAVELGAMRYLGKPFSADDLLRAAGEAVRLRRIAALKREALAHLGNTQQLVGDRAGMEAHFSRALETVEIFFQPIVAWSTRRVHAFEALMRPREPSFPNPGALLAAAERIDKIHELGRVLRARALEPFEARDPETLLFVNVHPSDLLDEALFDAETSAARNGARIVIEVTERAALDHVRDVKRRVQRLRDIGFRIAIDDLGAGYAGLASFTLLEPEVAKIDMSLVRDIDRSPMQRTIVRGLVALCGELGISVVAEGIETVAERDVIVDLGVDLLQGYLFARPGPAFPAAAWGGVAD